MADNKQMKRGLQQSLYKYLPGTWADFTQSGGGVTYAVRVKEWNGIYLTEINNKRLLRVVNSRVKEFINSSNLGTEAVVDFASDINEETYDVLRPKPSDTIAAITTEVNPLVFVCNSCGKVRQDFNYDEFKRNEFLKCDKCHKRMTQIRMIRYCECGYADGIYVPSCQNKDHGRKYMTRRGSGTEFVCSKCGKRAFMSQTCPECGKAVHFKPALDSSHYLPASVTLIDLLDRRKDVFLENESDARGEKTVIAQYLGLIPQEQYEGIIAKGKIEQTDEFEKQLEAEAQFLKSHDFDDSTIARILDAKRRDNPNGIIYNAIASVSNGLSVSSNSEFTPIAEEILEYDELVHTKVTLSLDEAEKDAALVNDGYRIDFHQVAKELGFSKVKLCSGVPIITCSYGYTRHKKFGDNIKLRGFPKEMSKRNVYAAKLETEGVLFEFDRERILKWLLINGIITQDDMPTDASEVGLKLWFLDHIKPDAIGSFSEIDDSDSTRITKIVYTLLHSVSHALIREAAEICGLDSDSLSEYILPNIPAVFIYCSNSQGFSMGALTSAFQTHFDKWLRHARTRSKKCLFDPICISKEKACVGCLFVNEVSCQHFNKDLDRSYLCGHFDVQKHKRVKGFWEI